MSDKIDEIIDRLIKGGPGSGKRGHKTAPAPVNYDSHGNYRKEDYPHQEEKPTPVSDTKRELDPDKKKKILASDKKVARKESKDISHEELQSKIDSHKELSENKFLSPASRESYAAKHKALISQQKKRAKAGDIKREEPKKEEGIASRPGPFGNINKGGPGSGRKGHMGVTPDKTQRESNRQKAGESMQTSRDAKRIMAELDLNKEDMKEIRDYASAEGITPSQFIVNNKDHIKTNLKKGGPGSGVKGHTTNREDPRKESKSPEPDYDDILNRMNDLDDDLDKWAIDSKPSQEEYEEEVRSQVHEEFGSELNDAQKAEMIKRIIADGHGGYSDEEREEHRQEAIQGALEDVYENAEFPWGSILDRLVDTDLDFLDKKEEFMDKAVEEYMYSADQNDVPMPDGRKAVIDDAYEQMEDLFQEFKDATSEFKKSIIDDVVDRLLKGGPGSGRKGHKTSGKIEPKHFEPNANLRDKNKGLDRITPEQSAERKRNKEEAQRQARKERLKERADAAHRAGNHKEYERLISEVRTKYPYKGNPAAEAVSPTSHGTKPAGEGKYGVEGGKYTDPASEGASAAMSDNRRANTEKYLKQLKTSLSLETDPAERANFEKDIKDIEAELKMKKSIESLYHLKMLAETGRIKPKQKRNMSKSEEQLEKFLAGAALKTGARVVQNLVKPAGGGDGSGADKPVGGYDGASVAGGVGGAKKPKGPEAPKIKKSLAERLDEMHKGGIGSGRKGHHSIGRDYGDNEHDSVFEDSRYDSTQEREIFMDKMKEAINREEERADQRIREKESTAKRGISRKPKKEVPKKTLMQRLAQKVIDAI